MLLAYIFFLMYSLCQTEQLTMDKYRRYFSALNTRREKKNNEKSGTSSA